MKTIPLSEFVEGSTQTEAAQLLGVTQGAIGKALFNGRKIYLTFDKAGQLVSAYEVSPFPARKAVEA